MSKAKFPNILSSVVVSHRLTLLSFALTFFSLPVTPHGQEASHDSSEDAAIMIVMSSNISACPSTVLCQFQKTASPRSPAHYRLRLQTSFSDLWPLLESPHGLWPVPASAYKTSMTSAKTMPSPANCRSARGLTTSFALRFFALPLPPAFVPLG